MILSYRSRLPLGMYVVSPILLHVHSLFLMQNGARQRWVIEPDSLIQAPTPNPTNSTTGFPTGTYFEIRARGSNNVLLTRHFSGEDGTQLIFWARPAAENELRAAVSIICAIVPSSYHNPFLGLLYRQNRSTLPW
jgi:hypothetical protein